MTLVRTVINRDYTIKVVKNDTCFCFAQLLFLYLFLLCLPSYFPANKIIMDHSSSLLDLLNYATEGDELLESITALLWPPYDRTFTE